MFTSCGKFQVSSFVGLEPVYSITCQFLPFITLNLEPFCTTYIPLANFSNQSALFEYQSSKALFNWINGLIHEVWYNCHLFLSGWYAKKGNWS